jgi:hypothetical protein
MADIALTVADIRPLPGSIMIRAKAAATMAVGDAVCISAADTVAQADADAAATQKVIGVIVGAPGGKTAVASGDWVDVCVFGAVTGFTSLTAGTLYWNSVTAGKIADASPGSAKYGWLVGRSLNANTILLNCVPDQVAVIP